MDASNFTFFTHKKSIFSLFTKHLVSHLTLIIFVRLAFVACCLLSLYFAVTFWATFGSSVTAMYAFACMAVVLEVTKFISLPFFQTSVQQKRYLKALGCLFTYIILASVSVLSTTGKLQFDSKQNLNNAMANDAQHQQTTQAIVSQQRAIDLLLESAHRDINGTFRTRGQYILEKVVPEAQLKLAHEKANLQTLRMNVVSTSPFFAFLHVLLDDQEIEETRWSVYLDFLLGLLLDFCACFLLLFSKGSTNYSNTIKNESIEPPTSGDIKSDEIIKSNKSVPIKDLTSDPKALLKPIIRIKTVLASNDLYEKVKNLIQSHACQPVIREIKKLAHIGTVKATQFLQQMVKEGILNRHNNRYVLSTS